MMNLLVTPKVRPFVPEWVLVQGQPRLALRDPEALTDDIVLVPPELVPLLALCDGTRTLPQVQALLATQYSLFLSEATVGRILAELDLALVFEGERVNQARRAAFTAYRTAPFRPPALAGLSYPADPHELSGMLQKYLAQTEPQVPSPNGAVRGIISPHIDYGRGGPVYAAVWARAAAAVREAEVAVVFGTDHSGGAASLTPTRQNYATPWGVLPTYQPAVDAVVDALGEERAFAQELHHRKEHSIELAVIWLHYIRGGQPLELVPLLCGSFHPFILGDAHPSQDGALLAALKGLREVVQGKRTLIVAAADLAHVGPAFGDDKGLDAAHKLELEKFDQDLMGAVCQGAPEEVLMRLRGERDRQKVCGLPPIYLALHLLGRAKGDVIAYAQCPADPSGESVVSIAGVVWT